MARLSLSSDFLADYAGLENRMQRKVSEVINTFEKLDAQQLRKLKGLNLEAYNGSADPRSRTIRIDDNHRGIVLDAGDNENYVLTRICTHDDAERWMTTTPSR